MKTTISLRWLALGLAPITLLALFTTGCSRTVPMEATDDVNSFVDYGRASRRLPGMASVQVQHELGSPTDIRRTEAGKVCWIYSGRFCETDARCVYKQVTLVFENKKLISIQPD